MNSIPFVSYRKPNTLDIVTFFPGKSGIHEITSLRQILSLAGFVFFPFRVTEKTPGYLFQPRHVLHGNRFSKEETIFLERGELSVPESGLDRTELHISSREEYNDQIAALLSAVHSGELNKAILSRIMLVDPFDTDNIPEVFQGLLGKYPEAYTYMFFIPGKELWLGAFTESLLRIRENKISTMSVAGTQAIRNRALETICWDSKDIEEQRTVSEYIRKRFRQFGISDYTEDGPYAFRAGRIVHLRTDFTADIQVSREKLGQLLEALHPTPAVCGTPKQDAIQKILAVERHDRLYYSGFMGSVNIDNETNLFVNLRCMKVLSGKLALFAGGGIVSESDPDKEWEETCIKAQTLLSVIKHHQ
ncbi:isochorismate synthase [bacterium]|nr:isochorismate synthase [bacterium]